MIEVYDFYNHIKMIASDFILTFPEHELFIQGKRIGKVVKYYYEEGRLKVQLRYEYKNQLNEVEK